MDKKLLIAATAGYDTPPPDWIPASQVRPLILEDPALLWLEYHGAQFGFHSQTSSPRRAASSRRSGGKR